MRHILAITATLVLGLSTGLYAAGLTTAIKNTFDTAHVSSEGVMKYESQTRGYYTFGHTRLRWETPGVIRPFSLSAPNYSVGCNGIDINMGGFSYIKGDELVDKLKNMSGAAASFFFEAALSTLCKDCAAILNKLEDFANAINALNFDSCAAAQAIGEHYGRRFGEYAKSLGSGKDAADKIKDEPGLLVKKLDEINKYLQGVDLTQTFICAVIDCDSGMKYAAVNRQGSLIRLALASQSMAGVVPNTPQEHERFASVMRGLLGDLYGYTLKSDKAGEDLKSAFLAIEPSASSPEDFINALLYGTTNCLSDGVSDPSATIKCVNAIAIKPVYDYSSGKPADYPAVVAEAWRDTLPKGFIGYTQDRLNKIIEDINAGTTISSADQAFLGNLPYPIIKVINVHKAGVFSSSDLESVAEYIAIELAKVAATDLFDRTHRSVDEIASVWLAPRLSDPTSSTRLQELMSVIDFKARVGDRARSIVIAFDKPVSEARAKLKVVIDKIEQQEKIEKALKKQFFVGSFMQGGSAF